VPHCPFATLSLCHLADFPYHSPFVRIASQAPTRIDLAGGTLDIWPLYLFHVPSVTVNCAISLYARATIETHARADRSIRLVSRDTGRAERFASFAHLVNADNYRLPLLAHLVRYFAPRRGFTLATDSEAPAGAGLGGSSAMAVAICAALDRLTASRHTLREWIHISRDVECMVLGVPTGTQDHYPAAFGGINAIRLEPGEEARSEIRVDARELERRLVLCYTGKPRRSGINNWEVMRSHIEGDRRVFRNLSRIAAVARELCGQLSLRRWSEVGRLVREEWEFRRRNLPTISTPVIDRVISSARRAGALGGKVCGAGGGGCLALVIEPGARPRVEAAVEASGGRVLPFRIDRRGVRVKVYG
jgi:D-glycero-alpha-D-manno-heptose-7-phosphate kinase